jgi:hypothetical protein
MSDVPTGGAQSTQRTDLNTSQGSGAQAHEIEDIDRELEEYLREKRSGNGLVFGDHSVDDQLAKLREKFATRVTPTKESEKPREVEIVKNSPRDESIQVNNPVNDSPTNPVTEVPLKPPAKEQVAPMSHEDLIRSLEEKYSKGESTNLPPQTPPQSDQKEGEIRGETSSILADLKESIDPLERTRVEELLNKASKMSGESQKSLVENLLARFKRNKERKELYTKTQKELENELELFILKSMEAKSAEPKVTVAPSAPEQESVPGPSITARGEESKPAEVIPAPKEAPAEGSAPVQPQGGQTEKSESALLRKKYETYLSKLEKKPVVLVYEPENGFVRKVVDPNDSNLKLAFSIEGATGLVVLTVFDVRDNELGVFKIPQGELDN